jgi:hypothetical protein
MFRRVSWLVAGGAIGAGGTLWARRRVERLSERVQSGAIIADIGAGVDRGTRAAMRRVQVAVDAGRLEARRREDELRQTIGTGERFS